MGYINPRKFEPLLEHYAQYIREAEQARVSRQALPLDHAKPVNESSGTSSLGKIFEGFQRGWTQTFPFAPTFTEQSIRDLSGRVYFIAGGDTGVGKEVARILYSKSARVYVGCRSEASARAAFDDIRTAHPGSQGGLAHQHLDLSDLGTVGASAAAFASREAALHVLFNDAGAGAPGALLLAKLLTPTLVATARAGAVRPGAVRVVWASSSSSSSSSAAAAAAVAEKGIDGLGGLGGGDDCAGSGSYLHLAREYAKRHGDDSVVSVAVGRGGRGGARASSDHPLQYGETWASWAHGIWASLFLRPTGRDGACAEVWAGVGEEVTMESTGACVTQSGRLMSLRDGILATAMDKSERGMGASERFWDWTEEQIKPYV